MKRNDFILAIAIFLIAGVGLLLYMHFGKQSAATVLVTVDGKMYGTYSLQKDRDVFIDDTNHLVIKDKKADMIAADCPDQICVEHKSISKNKETIVCLPNKVIVEIVGGKETKLDAVAN